MIDYLKINYRKSRSFYHRLKFYYSINWSKTLYFNFRKFPFHTAKQLPVFFYGRVKFSSIKGQITIDAPIKKGMIGFGQPYEMTTVSKGCAELALKGKMVFKGHVQFGKDYFIYIDQNGYCEFGHMSSMASGGKIMCIEKITLGDYARLGSESQIMDTNFHQMIDTKTKERYPMTSPISIGNYNFIGNRVSIMSKTKTPDFCTIASNSVCTNDYTSLGENVLIGGIPSKLLRENICRDWEGERKLLDEFLIV